MSFTFSCYEILVAARLGSVFYHRPSENSTRTSEQEISLLGFASSAHKMANGEFGEDVFSFGQILDDIFV